MMAMSTATKAGAAIALVVAVYGYGYKTSWTLGSFGGPKFKVEYGYFMVPALDCPGGRCQQPQTQRLKVQSLNKGPVAITSTTINGRRDCDANLLGLFGLAGFTMNYGEVRYVLTTCEPLELRIVTDKGESTYTFN
jgi:hypothetical protein